jgi:hypothetical protein
MVTRTVLAAVATTTLILGAGLLSPAAASHGGGGDDVRTRGHCSGRAHWKLKAKPDDGRIEIEGEVDSNVSGQRWKWRLKHDGSISAHGRKRTSGRSGSFEVERRMTNLSGKDHFVFRAEHRGQVCRGTISF